MEIENSRDINNSDLSRLTNLVLLAVDIIVTEEFNGMSSKSIKVYL